MNTNIDKKTHSSFFNQEYEHILSVLFENSTNNLVIDENKLLNELNFHKVSKLFKIKFNPTYYSTDFSLKLESLNKQIREKQFSLVNEAFTLLNKAKQIGIQCSIIKGPILSFELYQDFFLRNYSDVDFLISYENIDQFLALAKTLDFTLDEVNYKTKKQKKYYFKAKKHVIIYKDELIFEVHVHFLPHGKLINSEDLMLKERVEFKNGAITFLTFNKIDLFIYISIHGLLHYFYRLSWIVDVIELLKNENQNFIDSVNIRSKELGCELIIFEALNFIKYIQGLEYRRTKVFTLLIKFQQEQNDYESGKKKLSFNRKTSYHFSFHYQLFGIKSLLSEIWRRRIKPENWNFFVFPDQIFNLNLVFAYSISLLRKITNK